MSPRIDGLSNGGTLAVDHEPPGVMQRGASGSDVKQLQTELNEKSGSKLELDGNFGDKTKAAVQRFQTKNGLPATGIADADTLAKLKETPKRVVGPQKPVDTFEIKSEKTGKHTGVDLETQYQGPGIPKGKQQPQMEGWSSSKKISLAVKNKADEILKRKDLPIGSTVEFDVNGTKYKARLEWHKHAPTDNVKQSLKDWHRGVTVYEGKQ